MRRRRVAITGMGLMSPIGDDLDQVVQALREGRSGVRAIPSWSGWPGLHTRVAATVNNLDEKAVPRESRRSMGRVALLAAAAAERALVHARLNREVLQSGRAGISIGQTVGSPAATELFFETLRTQGVRGLKSTTFFQLMSHSAAANLALMFKVTGRVWAPAAACASSSQAIGQAYETIRDGYQEVMLCGGTEELHVTTAATFDIVGGTSRAFNDTPAATPRPFDRVGLFHAMRRRAHVRSRSSWDGPDHGRLPRICGNASGRRGLHQCARDRHAGGRCGGGASDGRHLRRESSRFIHQRIYRPYARRLRCNRGDFQRPDDAPRISCTHAQPGRC